MSGDTRLRQSDFRNCVGFFSTSQTFSGREILRDVPNLGPWSTPAEETPFVRPLIVGVSVAYKLPVRQTDG